jgi:type IV pilus assembly protein PilA
MKNQKGFTLIELMIVVAIIAILAAIAISQYQDYVIRSQVSEGSSLADGTKTAVAEFYNNTGRFPGSNESAGLSPEGEIQGNYVSELSVYGKVSGNPGTIEAVFSSGAPQKANEKIDTAVLKFSPITHGGSIAWSCGDGGGGKTIESKWLPSVCR